MTGIKEVKEVKPYAATAAELRTLDAVRARLESGETRGLVIVEVPVDPVGGFGITSYGDMRMSEVVGCLEMAKMRELMRLFSIPRAEPEEGGA